MRIVTAGDYKFRDMICTTAHQARVCGYEIDIYNLGGLGFGIPYAEWDMPSVADAQFATWKSVAQHKPDVIIKSMTEHQDSIFYLDGDAVLLRALDFPFDFDIAITARLPNELDKVDPQHKEPMGRSNAGVILFNNTPSTQKFLIGWQNLTVNQKNDDQWALNHILNPDMKILKPWTRFRASNCEILVLPGTVYNYYYFDSLPCAPNVCVLHFKGKNKERFAKEFKTRFGETAMRMI